MKAELLDFSNVISRVACCIFNDYKAAIFRFLLATCTVSLQWWLSKKRTHFLPYNTPLDKYALHFLISAQLATVFCSADCVLCSDELIYLYLDHVLCSVLPSSLCVPLPWNALTSLLSELYSCCSNVQWPLWTPVVHILHFMHFLALNYELFSLIHSNLVLPTVGVNWERRLPFSFCPSPSLPLLLSPFVQLFIGSMTLE